MYKAFNVRSIRPAGAALPETPPVMSPSDVSVVEGDIVFSWTAMPRAARYAVRLCADETMTNGCSLSAASSDPTRTIRLGPGVHYWQLVSGLAPGVLPEAESYSISPVRKFTVTAAPPVEPTPQEPERLPAPTLFLPHAGEVVNGRSVTVWWGAVRRAGSYEIRLCRGTNECRTIVFTGANPHDSDATKYKDAITLADEGDYTWSVRAIDASTGAAGASSPEQAFRVVFQTTQAQPPDPAVTAAAESARRRMPDYAWGALGALATLLILRPWERK